VQVAVHAQEGILAQLARIVGVAHHAIDDVPTQALMVADQRLESPAVTGQYGRDQQPVGIDHPWLPWTHPVIDTPEGASVASFALQPADRQVYPLSLTSPYRL
jgi:hypothetical protein